MATSPFSVVASHVWIGGTFRPARVGVRDGVIDEVVPLASRYLPVGPPGDVGGEVYRLPEDTILLPGLVEPHVRVAEPGNSEGEGFRSATLAAAARGITTILDLPIPPATTEDALRSSRKAAGRNAFVDVGFLGGVVPGNLGSLAALRRAGVIGFACSLSPSGELPRLDAEQLVLAMAEVAALGSRLSVHAGPSAIETVIDAVRRVGCHTHLLHLGDGGALAAIRAAKREGLPLTVGTRPNHLSLVAEDAPDGGRNRDLFWRGVLDGTIDAIAGGGVAELQAGLSSVWTEAKRRRIPLSTLLPLFTTGPATVAGIDDAGEIAVGRPANLTVFGPERATSAGVEEPQRNGGGPRALAGRILHTWLHGATVFEAQTGGHGQARSPRRTPKGRLLSAS
jgi:allantoinase